MSQLLISRSPDLKKLRDEGFNIEIRSGFVLVKDVPYVNGERAIKRGTLVSELTLAGDVTAAPSTHVAMLIGDYPCDKDGRPLERIRHSGRQELADGLVIDHSFSSKPAGGRMYRDYYDKMTTYVAILAMHARAIDPDVTARTYPVFTPDESESVFNYLDTASSRAGIGSASEKLRRGPVAIVGLGGTGAYLLDLLAKSPLNEIHLFDGDDFLTHNAFRAPGAAPVDVLVNRPKKVAYLSAVYSNMHRHVIAHPYFVDQSNVAELGDMDFVFLCMDASGPKKEIVEALEAFDVSFIDVGLGLELVDGSLRGASRVTASFPGRRAHLRSRVSLSDGSSEDPYATNIQVAELNALNAAMAVIKWKKRCGFYLDFENEGNSTYVLDSNVIINDDQE